jgi:phosphomethylpyrimidine synthase
MRRAVCREFASIVRDQHGYRLPLMTLGPIPTDAAVGEDHVANAVGGAFLAMQGGTNVLNSITREEHTGGIPAKSSIIEGLRAARVAAHAVNVSLHGALAADREVGSARDAHHTCVVDGGLFGEAPQGARTMGCTRCGSACPLRVNFDLERRSDPAMPDAVAPRTTIPPC